MPIWNEILSEIQTEVAKGGLPLGIAMDKVRKKYIKELSDYRNRNVILYYSGWLSLSQYSNLDINDRDMTGFMTTVKGLDRNKGLDLVIHTPGGNAQATEGIVTYLHKMFPDIQIFVPHMCMSAGTLLACSASEIWLGKQSCLGPIDPQFNGTPAYNIKKEFEEARKVLTAYPQEIRYWQAILGKYPVGFYYTVLDAIKISSQLAKDWLSRYMFAAMNREEKTKTIDNIVKKININTGSHAKHFDYEYCKNIGLLVKPLESDQKIQDTVLSIYHACQICNDTAKVRKIIENNLGQSYICNAR